MSTFPRSRRSFVSYSVAFGLGTRFCGSALSAEVPITAYVALDREFSEPVIQEFEKETGLKVRAKYDVESTKTIGLVNLIRSEAARPRADLFWNNEIINTIRLKKAGLLDSYHPKRSDDFPSLFRDRDGFWHGFAARARVLIVNEKTFAGQAMPRSISDLTNPKWRGRIGIAKPFFGTTATHAACLYAAWGPKRADRFFADLHANDVKVLAGNKTVAESVAAGNLAFGLTDTDDALVMKAQGHAVAIVYPDDFDDGIGTLFLPNTLAVIRNAPNPEGTRRLIDWLYRPETETRLSLGPSGQIPVSSKARMSPKVRSPSTVKPMAVDFDKAADLFEDVMKRLSGLFA